LLTKIKQELIVCSKINKQERRERKKINLRTKSVKKKAKEQGQKRKKVEAIMQEKEAQ